MGIFKFGFGTKFSMKALRSNLFGRIGRRGKGVVDVRWRSCCRRVTRRRAT